MDSPEPKRLSSVFSHSTSNVRSAATQMTPRLKRVSTASHSLDPSHPKITSSSKATSYTTSKDTSYATSASHTPRYVDSRYVDPHTRFADASDSTRTTVTRRESLVAPSIAGRESVVSGRESLRRYSKTASSPHLNYLLKQDPKKEGFRSSLEKVFPTTAPKSPEKPILNNPFRDFRDSPSPRLKRIGIADLLKSTSPERMYSSSSRLFSSPRPGSPGIAADSINSIAGNSPESNRNARSAIHSRRSSVSESLNDSQTSRTNRTEPNQRIHSRRSSVSEGFNDPQSSIPVATGTNRAESTLRLHSRRPSISDSGAPNESKISEQPANSENYQVSHSRRSSISSAGAASNQISSSLQSRRPSVSDNKTMLQPRGSIISSSAYALTPKPSASHLNNRRASISGSPTKPNPQTSLSASTSINSASKKSLSRIAGRPSPAMLQRHLSDLREEESNEELPYFQKGQNDFADENLADVEYNFQEPGLSETDPHSKLTDYSEENENRNYQNFSNSQQVRPELHPESPSAIIEESFNYQDAPDLESNASPRNRNDESMPLSNKPDNATKNLSSHESVASRPPPSITESDYQAEIEESSAASEMSVATSDLPRRSSVSPTSGLQRRESVSNNRESVPARRESVSGRRESVSGRRESISIRPDSSSNRRESIIRAAAELRNSVSATNPSNSQYGRSSSSAKLNQERQPSLAGGREPFKQLSQNSINENSHSRSPSLTSRRASLPASPVRRSSVLQPTKPLPSKNEPRISASSQNIKLKSVVPKSDASDQYISTSSLRADRKSTVQRQEISDPYISTSSLLPDRKSTYQRQDLPDSYPSTASNRKSSSPDLYGRNDTNQKEKGSGRRSSLSSPDIYDRNEIRQQEKMVNNLLSSSTFHEAIEMKIIRKFDDAVNERFRSMMNHFQDSMEKRLNTLESSTLYFAKENSSTAQDNVELRERIKTLEEKLKFYEDNMEQQTADKENIHKKSRRDVKSLRYQMDEKVDLEVLQELSKYIATKKELKKNISESETRFDAKLEELRLNQQAASSLEAENYKRDLEVVRKQIFEENRIPLDEKVHDIISKAVALKSREREMQVYNDLFDNISRDLDSKLYVVCQDTAALKALFTKQVTQPFYKSAQWLWNSGKLKMGSAVPWNIQSSNTDNQNFRWKQDDHNIRVHDAGLYEISLSFFTTAKPSIQLVVNGESVLSAINSPSYIVRHGSGFVQDGDGKMEHGTVTGISLVDFLALPSKSTISIHYHGVKKNGLGHGFVGLRRL